MKIYTKTGDRLTTSINKKRVYKNDEAIEVVGSIDEVQTALMVAYNFTDFEKIRVILLNICEDLFAYSYNLTGGETRFPAAKVKDMEKLIDEVDAKLPQLKEFIVPGKSRSSSLIHQARVTVRRAERRIIAYAKDTKVPATLLQYINRLSDLLFVLARAVDEKVLI